MPAKYSKATIEDRVARGEYENPSTTRTKTKLNGSEWKFNKFHVCMKCVLYVSAFYNIYFVISHGTKDR